MLWVCDFTDLTRKRPEEMNNCTANAPPSHSVFFLNYSMFSWFPLLFGLSSILVLEFFLLYSAIGVLVIFTRCNVLNDVSFICTPALSAWFHYHFSIFAFEVAEISFIQVVYTENCRHIYYTSFPLIPSFYLAVSHLMCHD